MAKLSLIVYNLSRAIEILILIRVLLSWLAPYTRNSFYRNYLCFDRTFFKTFRNLFSSSRFYLDLSPIFGIIAVRLISLLIIKILI